MSYFNISDKNIAHVYGYEAEWIHDVQSQVDRLNEEEKLFLYWDGMNLFCYVNKAGHVIHVNKLIKIGNEIPSTTKIIDATDMEKVFEYFNEGIFDALLTQHWKIEHSQETRAQIEKLTMLATSIQEVEDKYILTENKSLFMEVQSIIDACRVPALMNHFSKLCFIIEDWNMAVTYLTKVIAMMPEFADPYNSLGIVSWKLGKRKEAMGFFAEALIKNPYPHNTILNMIDAVKELGEYAGLARVLEYILEKDPSLDDCSLALAMSFMKLNKKDDAKQLLENLLANNPHDKDVKSMLTSLNT